jgi:hypothetical protein
MPTPTIPAGNLFMNATLYAGNGTTQTITNGIAGQAFQPDFVWIKERSSTSSHALTDSVRGASNLLSSNTTDAEATGQVALTSFNSNGFSVGADGKTNESSQTYVGWQWKAGGTAVTNTAGSITSSVSANTTSGFSVVTYTGTGSSGSVGHGLGVAPSIIIIKSRSSATGWRVYSANLGITSYLVLNSTAAVATASMWGTPTSTTFIIGGTGYEVNESSSTYVAYCWAPIAGYSAFGSYTGNGSADGPFVYLGFRPRFILYKRTDSTGDWTILDTSRSTYNAEQLELYPDSSIAETAAGGDRLDGLSNGFKIRNSGSAINASGGTYLYAAFAENPFKYSNAR